MKRCTVTEPSCTINADEVSGNLDSGISPLSESYLPPSGVMPIVVLQGSPYEMGYQYGLQAPSYISLVRDAALASALSVNTSQEIQDTCRIYNRYISEELTEFDFSAFFQGLSDSMNDQGIRFSPLDPVVMLYWGGRQGPQPPDHCTAFAVPGDAGNDSTIAGVNFDYYQVPSNSYSLILALYPENGHSCIIPSGAGRTGSNCVCNVEDLIYIMAAGPQQGPGDRGPGITGFLELPYVGMTCDTVPKAEEFLINSTRMFGLNHLLIDSCGDAEVLEATRGRYAVRRPGDHNETNYLIVTNFYLNPEMKPSQNIWNPLEYYPSSYYRYITAEKMIVDSYPQTNYSTAVSVLSSTDWWDGNEWHYNDPWSTNTINRFRPDVATLYSAIAVPEEHVVSICTGNPRMPFWGTLAEGQTGTYVNLTLSQGPENLVFNLQADAKNEMWKAVQALGKNPTEKAREQWATIRDRYWEAVWWLDRAVLEEKRDAKAVAYGRSATLFAGVIAGAEQLRETCAD
ncbi:MAG: hypothetical protein HPY61_11260 [Methanotrichaceae archaeon]|nr:hypothetical protein [Methanotrichaceae archaeon]